MAQVPESVRELWQVQFETYVNAGRKHGQIQMEKIMATRYVWGPHHENADIRDVVKLFEENPPKSGTHIIRVAGAAPTGILEPQIANQPAGEETTTQAMLRLEKMMEQEREQNGSEQHVTDGEDTAQSSGPQLVKLTD